MIDWNKIPNANANQNALANSSTHAIAVVDMEGRIIMANESATKTFGYESLVGMHARDIAPPPFSVLFTPEFMATGSGSKVRQFLRKDGRFVWMAAQGTLLKDEQGAPWGVFIYLHDITVERELKVEVEHLSNRLREVVSSIQQALNKKRELPPDITPTERDIAAMVKHGITSRDIATARGIGVKSVENMRVSLRKKLAVDRRANLRAALQEYGDL